MNSRNKKEEVLKKGCYSCHHMQYERACYEYPLDGDYFYCEKRDDEPETEFKTWPAKRRLKCFKFLPDNYFYIEPWRIVGNDA